MIKHSRGESAPFSKRGSTVLLEDIAAVEVAVLVEMIMGRGVNGGKFLQRSCVPEPLHRSFSSSERLVGILSAIVAPPTTLLIGGIADCLHRRSVRPKPVGYHRSRSTATLHRALQELQRGPAIPALRLENLKHLAFVIHRAPQIMRLSIDPDEHSGRRSGKIELGMLAYGKCRLSQFR